MGPDSDRRLTNWEKTWGSACGSRSAGSSATEQSAILRRSKTCASRSPSIYQQLSKRYPLRLLPRYQGGERSPFGRQLRVDHLGARLSILNYVTHSRMSLADANFVWFFNLLTTGAEYKAKMWHQSARFEKSWHPFRQIWIVFTHWRDPQLQVGENFNWIIWRLKG